MRSLAHSSNPRGLARRAFTRAQLATCAGALIGALTFSVPAVAEQPLRLGAGPQVGASVNSDQWLIGAFARLGGVCFFICGGDWGLGFNVIGGFGGNHLTLRSEIRLDRTFWFDDEDTIGAYAVVAATGQGSVPVGGFARFCDDTDLVGCGGLRLGFALGLGVRVRPGFLEAVLLTGELPSVAVTAGAHFSLWEPPS